jgi:hypothetical protein
LKIDRAENDDKLSEKQAKKAQESGSATVCTYRVTVFSAKRSYIISAETDAIMDKWNQSILKLCL